jgi:N-acetylmuramoyl-L-alanine amidase
VRVQDSSFLFGSVASGDTKLTINGSPVRVWPNGAWLAWLPFPSDTLMQFRIVARTAADTFVLIYPVRRDRSSLPQEVRVGRAWVDSVSLAPQGQVWLPRGEYLTLSTRAAEGSDVRLRLPDGRQVRLLPQKEWRELLPALRGFDRDTNKLRTSEEVRYVGAIRGRAIGPDPGPVLRGISVSLVRALGRAALRCVTGAPCPAPYSDLLGPDAAWATVEAALNGDTVRVRWPLQVSLLDTLPLIARLDDDTLGAGATDSLTPGRAAPGGTYAWFFPTGTRAAVTGRLNDDVRIRLSPVSEAWVPAAEARALPRGLPEPHATVGSVTATASDDRVSLRIPLTARVPFQVNETERSLALKLYSAVGDVDWMRYAGDSLIQRLNWAQTARDEVTISVDLTVPVWGYRTRWSRNDLLLEIRRPPRIPLNDPLRGRVIAVDPGHPPLGSTGPTGLREADANLAVALQLRAMLEAAGARVLMSRTTDTAVDLWPRIALADTGGADLLVSIHNNALPDGINPFTNNGTSVFYNQPRSVPLASEIQRALLRRLKLPDLGVSRGDLAVIRATWMPSALVEGMFMIIPEQEAALRSPDGARQYARGVYDGIRRFLLERARTQPGAGVGRPSSLASPKADPSPSKRGPGAGGPSGGVAP